MERTKIYQALKGVRGRQPVDIAALEQLMVRFSQLVVEQPWIKEIDINPLLASPDGLIALDARVVLHSSDMTEDTLPRLAIRPYPIQYVTSWQFKNGHSVNIRPIRPEDEPLLIQFHHTLSDRSIYLRYFHLIKLSQRISHERLTRLCFIDYDREMALIAESTNPDTGDREMLGVARMSKLHGSQEAEFSMLISDQYQHKSLGTELLSRLIQVARDEKLNSLSADIHPENMEMQHLCQKLGFHLQHSIEDEVFKAELKLNP
jgi:acetyltransferase